MGQWIVGVISFQKMYGLYGLKHHIVEISGDVTDADGRTTSKDRATQLLICEPLSFAVLTVKQAVDSKDDQNREPDGGKRLKGEKHPLALALG